MESLREHYALTLRHWVRNLEAGEREAVALTDEQTYRVWRVYMAGCSHAFSAAHLNLYQTLLVKPEPGGRSGMPWTREYMYDR